MALMKTAKEVSLKPKNLPVLNLDTYPAQEQPYHFCRGGFYIRQTFNFV